jgi:CheY-like chemotaxis protein
MPSGERAARGSATILLVEDERLVREVVGEILESAGYEVLKTSNADEAGKMFAAHPGRVDLLLTDVAMPGKKGGDLARELEKACPGLKTIYMSGYTEDAVLRQGLQDQGALFLPKPFSLELLTSKVREVLAGQNKGGTRQAGQERWE